MTVLHTKYRPQEFENVIGQSHVVTALANAIERKSSRSFVLSGGPGLGKTTLARISAQELGCDKAGIIEIDAATHTGIDDMREITRTLAYKPFGDSASRAIIVDECFEEGTLIDTPSGPRPIEILQTGDCVIGAKGSQTVISIMKRYPTPAQIIRLHFNDGDDIIVSREHPFLTWKGWEPAQSLLHKSLVSINDYIPPHLQKLWDELYEQRAWINTLHRLPHIQLRDMWQEICGHAQSNEQTNYTSKDDYDTTSKWTPLWILGNPGRQWHRSYTSTSFVAFAYWRALRISSYYWKWSQATWMAYLLQSRYWISRTMSRCGNWLLTNAGTTTHRYSTNQKTRVIGVDSYKVFKQGSIGTNHQNSPNNKAILTFYDLEIKEHPSFSVKHCIVHNCHRISAQAWDSLLKSIEEPPPNVYWFFCSTQPDKIPKTIISRSMHLRLKELGREQLSQLIDKIAKAEHIKLMPDIRQLIIAEAAGSPRNALVNLALCAAAKDRASAAAVLHAAAEDNEPILALCRALTSGQSTWPQIMQIVEQLADEPSEGVRIRVLHYVSKVVRGSKTNDQAGRLMQILDAFSTPFNQSEGLAPLLLAIGHIMLTE